MGAAPATAAPPNTVRRRLAASHGRTQTAVLLAAAAVAAGWTVLRGNGMWTASGTPGLDIAAFELMWAVMMAAMMFPSMAPTAALYLRSLGPTRSVGGLGFITGYAVVWSASGMVAYGLARLADAVAGAGGMAPRLAASAAFGACAAFYLSPVKYRMLGRCRHPLGLIIQYGGYRGRLRHLRAGLHHGATCLACCWSLMAMLIVFGIMNVVAMVAIAAVVATEKLWSHGVGFARLVGATAGGLALAVLVVPGWAVGLAGHLMP